MNSCNTLKNVLEKTQCDPRLTHANKDYTAHAAREAMRAESWIRNVMRIYPEKTRSEVEETYKRIQIAETGHCFILTNAIPKEGNCNG